MPVHPGSAFGTVAATVPSTTNSKVSATPPVPSCVHEQV